MIFNNTKRKDLLVEVLTTALIYSNEKMEDIMKIVKSLEESGLLVKGISETMKKEGIFQCC